MYHVVIFCNPVEVENHHFIMAEVGNLEALVQNEGLDLDPLIGDGGAGPTIPKARQARHGGN